ncbi:site-2 protease family protein [Nitrosophilus alvini]|uniref:site-2 protease family protein n=1 Tax=Nitrosophilus alvini TaxID=2714855 RepID=UPI00190A55E8|nr:site-2 protease family protein [Nitrosophilus alvini]
MNILEIFTIIATIVALVIAVVGHEIMHGYVAYRYGDSTAKDEGRLSINPIKHIDPVGTVIIPAMLYILNAGFIFGWAKPVPVDMRTVLRNGGEKAAIAVSLAGVGYNFTVAAIATLLLTILGEPKSIIELILFLIFVKLIQINIVLGIFNLWPIPPLDGSNALIYTALKMKMYKLVEFYQKIQPYGMIILIIVIATPLSMILFSPVYFLLIFLSQITGINLLQF